MKKIIKGIEPRAWTEYCATPGVEYAAIPELRESLIVEQGYICAYCLRRIKLDDSRVEHIKPRSVYLDLALRYSNMVLCCNGLINSDCHCDKRKGSQEITFDLFGEVFFKTLSYSSASGEIKSSNIQWNSEINKVLNLNNRLLMQNRKRALEGAIQCLSENSLGQLRKHRSLWEGRDKQGQFKPYCSIVLWYIDKKLKQMSRN